MLQEIRCPNCNKFVCESSGEVRRECERCKKPIHAQATPLGVLYIDEDMPPDEIHFMQNGKVVGKIVGIKQDNKP